MENWPAGWIGNEVQAYTSKLENARVENGNLIIDCWREGENPYDYSLYFDKNWKRDVDAMVLRDRNPFDKSC